MSEILNPQDAELEEVILGACLIEREAMPMVADRLRPEMFYFEKNALIYAALQAMYRDGRQIDIITVKNELGARGKLDAAGGPYELVRISGRVVSSVHLDYHVRILHEKHLRREMILGFHNCWPLPPMKPRILPTRWWMPTTCWTVLRENAALSTICAIWIP